MSATFKNAKKKLSQSELRRYMNEHKKSVKEVKKIESPLAKYNEQGQLTCILCKSIVRSEAVWTVHINAKQHKQNVEIAKKLKEKTNNFTTPLKRPLTPPLPEVPEKKIKGILKNSKTNQQYNGSEKKNDKNLPDDFFDSMATKTKATANVQLAAQAEMNENEVEMESGEVLPEGFFDDPKMDAKARHQEYKDPVEEEWDKFLKEIKDADNKSAAIIAEDQEEATTERQIDEIDEQMKNLSRVLDLEKKKEEVISVTNDTRNLNLNEDDDMEPNEDEFDEFLDWRSKKSFK